MGYDPAADEAPDEVAIARFKASVEEFNAAAEGLAWRGYRVEVEVTTWRVLNGQGQQQMHAKIFKEVS